MVIVKVVCPSYNDFHDFFLVKCLAKGVARHAGSYLASVGSSEEKGKGGPNHCSGRAVKTQC